MKIKDIIVENAHSSTSKIIAEFSSGRGDDDGDDEQYDRKELLRTLAARWLYGNELAREMEEYLTRAGLNIGYDNDGVYVSSKTDKTDHMRWPRSELQIIDLQEDSISLRDWSKK